MSDLPTTGPAANDASNNSAGYTTDASGSRIPDNQNSPASNNRVIVSLQINVDVSGNVDLFTSTGALLTNVVACGTKLSLTSLFDRDSSSAAFEFYEPSGSPADISGSVYNVCFYDPSGVGAGAITGTTVNLYDTFVAQMAAVIEGVMDASNAAPFVTYPNTPKCQVFDNFGELTLALYAHYIFGHAAATAAIDNDEELIAYVNSNDSMRSTGAAQIATLLARALASMTPETASSIVGQVVAQDPSRARGVDNTQDARQTLLFAEHDVIYVSITVQKPSITVGPVGNTPAGRPGANTLVNLVDRAFAEQAPVFNLQIELSAALPDGPL